MVYDALVVGAGIAGIAASIRLRKMGLRVLVLEKNSEAGGKMREIMDSGYRWDTGPSLFTMPELVNELYSLCDVNPETYFSYQQQEESCRYFFEDDSSLVFYTDRKALETEIKSKLGLDASDVFKYFDAAAEKYDKLGEVFLENSIHSLGAIPFHKIVRLLPHIIKSDLLSNLHKLNLRTLKNNKLIQIFDRYATYNGSDPYRASGVLSMIPHLEQNIGTYFPKNGMRSIVSGLFQLAKDMDVHFSFDEKEIKAEKDQQQYHVKTSDAQYKTPKLVCAIDHLTFYRDIMEDADLFTKYVKQERSSSAIVFYWGIKSKFPQLGLHNIFFSGDYENEFSQIFKSKEIPDEPTIYIHISSKVRKEDAPDYGENWFVMINVPPSDAISPDKVQAVKKIILDLLNKKLSTKLESLIECEHVWTPKAISSDTGAYMGALYGAASNRTFSAISRHPNFSRKYDQLYFCGGTVHPGGGIPLSLQSAKIVEKMIKNER